ncbi:MAG: hypothetical protein ACRDTU_11300 [Micromonosporaceae bacterium]
MDDAGGGGVHYGQLMPKAREIYDLAVKQRAEEINGGAGTLLRSDEEWELYGTQTGGATTPEVVPGSAPWKRLEEKYRWIPDFFEPFTELPDPARFDPMIASMEKIMSSLGMPSMDSDELEFGRAGLGAISTAGTEFSHWTGDAADSFLLFASQYQGIARNQVALADVLRRAMKANKRIFVRARTDIYDVAAQTAVALKGSGAFGGDDLEATLSIISAVAGLASAAATGGATLPLAFAAAGAVAGVGAAVAGNDDGKKKRGLYIGGHTVDTVLDSMVKAASEVRGAIDDEERKIVQILGRNLDVVIDAKKNGPANDPEGEKCIVAPRPLSADLKRGAVRTTRGLTPRSDG